MKQRIILTGLIMCGLLGFSTIGFAGEWEEKPDMPQIGAHAGGIWGLGANVVNEKIYTIGGQDDLVVPGKVVREYDPEKDEWTDKKKLIQGRFRLGTATVRNKIYAFGGTANNFETLPNVDEYDPKTDTWTVKANIADPANGIRHRCGRRQDLYHWRRGIFLFSVRCGRGL